MCNVAKSNIDVAFIYNSAFLFCRIGRKFFFNSKLPSGRNAISICNNTGMVAACFVEIFCGVPFSRLGWGNMGRRKSAWHSGCTNKKKPLPTNYNYRGFCYVLFCFFYHCPGNEGSK